MLLTLINANNNDYKILKNKKKYIYIYIKKKNRNRNKIKNVNMERKINVLKFYNIPTGCAVDIVSSNTKY
jgi:hypothetical protein